MRLTYSRSWIAIAIGISLAVTALTSSAGGVLLGRTGSLPVYLVLFCFALVLPWRAALAYLLILSCALSVIWFANAQKASLTMSPLTVTDFVVFGKNPFSSMEALKLPNGFVYPVLAVTAISLVLLLVVSIRALHSAEDRVLRLAAIGVLVLNFAYLSGFTATAVAAVIAKYDVKIWDTKVLVKLSDTVGIPAFLLYSAEIQGRENAPYFVRQSVEPPTGQEIADAASSIFKIEPRQSGNSLPNIVAVLAESTFDPNHVFNLDRHYANYMFEANDYTHALAPLNVTPVGGGTWISEFEFLTGLDARMFGYSGYYTHTMLAPYVKKSIVTYLGDHGYDTVAYYGTDADFFNARNAFTSYGFRRFLEKSQLGITAPGWFATDVEIVDAVIKASSSNTEKPFFKHINLLQNHWPHKCEHFKPSLPLQASFADSAKFAMICHLNEYLLRARSSEEAVRKLVEYLKSEEKKTGRPFVLILYGDHQPHTFTQTAGTIHDYQKFRRDPDLHTTFFHVMSSARDPITWPSTDVAPLPLLPTILSAYVANSIEDIYLPISAFAFRRCGTHLLSSNASGDMYLRESSIDPTSGGCSALPSILAGYQRSGVMSFQ